MLSVVATRSSCRTSLYSVAHFPRFVSLSATRPSSKPATAKGRSGDRHGATTPAAPVRALPELANFSAASTRLAFKSLPYAAPPHILFPPIANVASHRNALFSLRTFPAVSRNAKSSQRPTEHLALSRPTPPPSLHHTTSPLLPLLSKDEMRQRQTMLKRYHAPYTMSLTVMAGKKAVHKSAVVRERCKRRMREAIRMVVMRGARAGHAGDSEALAFDVNEEGAKHWLVRGHTYIINITLEVYLHPFPSLVDAVRKALLAVKRKCEERQYEKVMNAIPAPPPSDED